MWVSTVRVYMSGGRSHTSWRSWARDWIGEIQHRPAPTVAAVSGTMDSKKTVAERFIRWIRNKWGNDARWEEPPVSWTVGSSSFTSLELASMVLYNGASGVPWSSGVNDNGANATFRSPWNFDPNRPAGSRWQFHDNLNPISNHPYATTVIVDEWQHGLPTAE